MLLPFSSAPLAWMDNFLHQFKNILLVSVTQYLTYTEKWSSLNNAPFFHGALITLQFIISVWWMFQNRASALAFAKETRSLHTQPGQATGLQLCKYITMKLSLSSYALLLRNTQPPVAKHGWGRVVQVHRSLNTITWSCLVLWFAWWDFDLK